MVSSRPLVCSRVHSFTSVTEFSLTLSLSVSHIHSQQLTQLFPDSRSVTLTHSFIQTALSTLTETLLLTHSLTQLFAQSLTN